MRPAVRSTSSGKGWRGGVAWAIGLRSAGDSSRGPAQLARTSATGSRLTRKLLIIDAQREGEERLELSRRFDLLDRTVLL